MDKHVGTRVVARRGSKIIYNNIPKSCEWLIMNFVVNVIGKFYQDSTFFGERRCVMITSNNSNWELIWKCKQRHG